MGEQAAPGCAQEIAEDIFLARMQLVLDAPDLLSVEQCRSACSSSGRLWNTDTLKANSPLYRALHESALPDTSKAGTGVMQAAPLKTRRMESARISPKYPDRIPVLCDRAPRSLLPEMPKKELLVPPSMLFGELKYVIHKRVSQMAGLSMGWDQTICLFVNSTANHKSGALMSEIYDMYKSEDGFLYITYSAENGW